MKQGQQCNRCLAGTMQFTESDKHLQCDKCGRKAEHVDAPEPSQPVKKVRAKRIKK